MDGSDQGQPPPQSTSRSETTKRTLGLWFDDATNVIEAGDHQFRVHRGILSARSQVLRRLFSDPTPEGIRRVEGCPVIHLPDDGDDVRRLLLAIYDPAFFEPPPKDVPVKVVLSIARLSHKYEIQHLRHRAILHMERYYPLDMDTFISHSLGALSENLWLRGLETTLEIVVTATAINAIWILPAVYYHCAHRTLFRTFHASPSWNDPQKIPILRNILTGKIKLEILDARYVELLGTPPCSGCLNRELCALHKLVMVRGLPSSLASEEKSDGGKCHTLTYWWDREWLKNKHCKELCAPCASACMRAYESARDDYWDSTPSAFNLPSWKGLKLLRGADFNG